MTKPLPLNVIRPLLEELRSALYDLLDGVDLPESKDEEEQLLQGAAALLFLVVQLRLKRTQPTKGK